MKKSEVRIIITSLIVLILAVGACFVYFFLIKKPEIQRETPEERLAAYVTALKAADFETMYGMLDADSQMRVTQEEFVTRNRNIYQGIEAANIQFEIQGSDETTNSKERETIVVYKMSFETMAGPVEFENKATFLLDADDSPFMLHWTDAMIFPELTATDKVNIETEEAKRGDILDRNGVLLAGDGIASSVGLVPGKMSADATADIAQMAQLLGISAESIENMLNASWVNDDSLVPLKTLKWVSDRAVEEGSASASDVENYQVQQALLQIPGVTIYDVTVRSYPLGEAASHLTGYIQAVTAEDLEEHEGEGYDANSVIGRSGMEGLYEKELKGSDGCTISIKDSQGNTKSVLARIPKQDGETIQLTIDARLQEILYNAYKEDKSCSVAMNPKTGEVLALVSTPSYDSNDFVLGLSDAKWSSLNEDERNPLYNRFRQVFSPGSSIKPVMAAIGLDTGIINPDEDYGNVGLSWQLDSSWGDYHVTTLHAYEPVILKNAIIYSDNIYFAKSALKIGAETLTQELSKLGFNETLPFEITMTTSQYASSETIDNQIQLADTGYGQGQMLINPLHLATLYTAFANDGNVIKPYLRYTGTTQPEIWLNAFSTDTAAFVKDAMINVISDPNGTGYGAYRADLGLAGKTGTAEIKASQDDQTGTELGWFGVFTTDTTDADALLILSMVEDVKDRGGSGYVVEKMNEVLSLEFIGNEAR